MAGLARRRSAAGFTLIEVLVGVAIFALVGVAVAAISVTGAIQVSDDSQERQAEATTAQWASLVFARDIQGSAALVAECAPGSGTHLLTVQASDSVTKVEYRTDQGAGGYRLQRTVCGEGAVARTVIDGLAEPPTVVCEAADGAVGDCAPATAPRRVQLQVERTPGFSFELDAARRLTEDNSAAPPLEVPAFVSLGGDTPLRAGGSSRLEVVGNALINRPNSTAVAVNLFGSTQLSVSGEFKLQQGASCSGCPAHANKQPGTFRTRLQDPLRFVPEPSTSSLPVRTACPVQGGVRVCEPGVYTTQFPPSGGGGGGVKDFVLQPGVYALRDGIKINNGSLAGDGVLIYNQTGDVKITGADLTLTPPTSGTYAGMLFFQARTNSAQFEIVGNASLGPACPSTGAVLSGTIYAPESENVVLGGGNGRLCVGRVIGQNLEASGGGTVIVDGS